MLSIHWYRRSYYSVVKMLGVDVTYDVNFQYGGCHCIETCYINGDAYVKIKRWRSKGMQEKELIMVFCCG